MTAVAADQSPGSPRFITLPPGSVGSVILDEFPEVANAAKVLPPSSHGVEHFISTKGLPIASKFRRPAGAEKLQAAKAEFEQLKREGIVRRSTSPWASPLHMVMKKDGDVAALRRLPLPQPGDGARHVPSSRHAGFFCQGRRMQGLQQD